MTADDWPEWPPPARPVHTHHLPEETPMPDRWEDKPNRHAYCDAEISRLRAELDAARADFGAALEIEAANCAREIDRAVAAEAELDQARAERDQAYRTVGMLGTQLQQVVAEVERLRATVQRARQLADQWTTDSAWTVLGSDGTDSAAAELRDALAGPATTEEPDTPRRPGGAVYETQLHPTTTKEQQ